MFCECKSGPSVLLGLACQQGVDNPLQISFFGCLCDLKQSSLSQELVTKVFCSPSAPHSMQLDCQTEIIWDKPTDHILLLILCLMAYLLKDSEGIYAIH